MCSSHGLFIKYSWTLFTQPIATLAYWSAQLPRLTLWGCISAVSLAVEKMLGIIPTLGWFLNMLTQQGPGSILTFLYSCYGSVPHELRREITASKFARTGRDVRERLRGNGPFRASGIHFSSKLSSEITVSTMIGLSPRKHVANEHSRHIRTDGKLKTETLLSRMRRCTGQMCNARMFFSIHLCTHIYPTCCAATFSSHFSFLLFCRNFLDPFRSFFMS